MQRENYKSEFKIMSNLATKQKLMSEAEYLAFEEKSKIKHEFMDGEIFSMAGGKRNHSLAGTNISTELNLQLREKDCEVHANDFRVRVRTGHYVYPDVAVACGEIEIVDNDTTLLNPTVVFEVLSKSTEKRDRGEKLEDYFNLESVKDYILVSQDRVKVEHFHREKNDKWTLQIYTNIEDTLILDSIKCKVPLKLIYLKVKFPLLRLVKSNKKNGK
jgi:Uma2 family endonuclease